MLYKKTIITGKIGHNEYAYSIEVHDGDPPVKPLPPVLPFSYPLYTPLPCPSPSSCPAAPCSIYPHPSGDRIFRRHPVISAPPPLSGLSPVVSEPIWDALLPTPGIVPPPSSMIYGNASGAGYGQLGSRMRELMPPLPLVPRTFHVLPPNGPFTTFIDGKDETNRPRAYTSSAAVPPFSTLPWLRWPEGKLI